MHVAMLGSSAGIGYHSLLTLAARDDVELTLLLRRPKCFDDDEKLKPYLNTGRIQIIEGDATKAEDVEKLFTRHVDVVMSSVGGTPKMTLSGFQLTDPTVCTRAAQALLAVLSKSAQSPLPRVIVVTSMGIGNNHHVMPLALRLLYPWMLSGPHADKEGVEWLLQHAAASFPDPTTVVPSTTILSEADREASPKGLLPELTIIRPALLNDNEPKGLDKLKAGEDVYTYFASRREVADFITQRCLPPASEWVNRAPVLGY